MRPRSPTAAWCPSSTRRVASRWTSPPTPPSPASRRHARPCPLSRPPTPIASRTRSTRRDKQGTDIMAQKDSLGLLGIESAHWYVHDLERSRRFYTQGMDFKGTGGSHPDLTARGKQQSLVFQAGDIAMMVSQPRGEGGRASRWLKKHPDGVGTLTFAVKDVEKTFQLLDRRGATIREEIRTARDSRGGKLSWFSITTPFGDSTFRFAQRDGYRPLFPGMVFHEKPTGGQNRFGFNRIDHVTSNFRTLMPAIMWMEHVLGLERFWKMEFKPDGARG